MSVAAQRPPLFTPADRRRLAVVQAVGAALIALAWYLAAGRPDAGEQLVFVSLSLLGALVAVAGTAGLLLRGRRAIESRTALLLGPAPSGAADAPPPGGLVAGTGTRWFHRADCLLAQGRAWSAAPRSDHEAAGRKPCPACQPSLTPSGSAR